MRDLLKQGEKTQIYAISIDAADKSKEMIRKIEADGKGVINYSVLSDAGAKTIEAYGIRDERYAAKKFDGIPRPTVAVIDKTGQVAWIIVEDDYRKRPTNADIHAEIDKLAKKKK